MPNHPNRRIDPQIVQADQIAAIAIESFTDYSPSNPTYDKTTLAAKRAAMEAARTAELHAQNALNAARDAANAAEWEFHNTILGIKTQVIAQYGTDSDQVRAMGLKKKSDRKRVSVRSKLVSTQSRSTGRTTGDA